MYFFDANAFMEASRRYYANDIAPGSWTWLAAPRIAARVASVTAFAMKSSPEKDTWSSGCASDRHPSGSRTTAPRSEPRVALPPGLPTHRGDSTGRLSDLVHRLLHRELRHRARRVLSTADPQQRESVRRPWRRR